VVRLQYVYGRRTSGCGVYFFLYWKWRKHVTPISLYKYLRTKLRDYTSQKNKGYAFFILVYLHFVLINPLTPELNTSAQRCLSRCYTGDFASWTVPFVNRCVKNQRMPQLFIHPTCFGITFPSSGSVPSAFWEMLNWGAVDRILRMGVLCLVTWCVAIWDRPPAFVRNSFCKT
jgi:hypothetical protein